MTLNTAMSRGWTAAVAAAILATVAALAFLGIARAASVSDLTVGSATVAPGGTVTINVTATADALGAYRVDVGYNSTLVTATECTSAEGVCSIDVIAPDTVRVNGSKLSGSGITGTDVVLGTITFLAGNTEGTAALTVDASTLVLSSVETETLTATATNGAITIATPAATASPTATVTPGTVPQTGGAPGASSASSMAWLLAAAGLTVVAGGAWVLSRAGREN
jgi:hypothetical protein